MNHIFILIFLILIYLIILKVMSKYNSIENFYTYFIPYYNEKRDYPKYYLEFKDYYNSKKYKYNLTNFFLIIDKNTKKSFEKNDNIKLLKDIILSSTNVVNLIIKETDSFEETMKYINKNTNAIALIPNPVLFKEYSNKNKNYPKVNFINNIARENIFFISSRYNLYNKITDFNGKKMGIINDNLNYNIMTKEILSYLEFSNNIIFEKVELSTRDCFQSIINNTIDGFLFFDYKESKLLTEYLTLDYNNSFKIIPIYKKDLINSLERNKNYYSTFYDLNFLPKKYLPVRIGDKFFNQYNPDLETVSFWSCLICNKDTDYFLPYLFLSGLNSFLNEYNKGQHPQYKLYMTNLMNNQLLIPYHIGAQAFMDKVGITNHAKEWNPQCINLVGKEDCNEKVIKKYGWDYDKMVNI
jgi:TRAP-type uncharacterized transport system substrate-binding protein